MHRHCIFTSFLCLCLALSCLPGATEAFAPSTGFLAPPRANSAVASFRRKPTCVYKSQVNLEEPKQEEQTEETFDPFKLSSDNGESLTVAESTELQKQEDQKQLSIWAARGVLLLVAAIWGTNFAVSAIILILLILPTAAYALSSSLVLSF